MATMWLMAQTKRKRATARKSIKADVVRMRVSADEKLAMERMAARTGLNVSAWLRQLALREAGVLPKPEAP